MEKGWGGYGFFKKELPASPFYISRVNIKRRMQIPLFALSGLFIAISSGLMVFIMFAFGQNRLHRLWGVFCVSVFIWGLGGYFIGTAQDSAAAAFWWRFAHIGVAFIPTLFLHFVYDFLQLGNRKLLAGFYALAGLFAFLAVFSDALIANMRFVFDEFYYDSPPGVLYPFFTLYFFGLVIWSHYLLYRDYSEPMENPEEGKIRKARIRYFFIAMLTSFAGGSMSFLPVYKIDVYPITNFTVTVYPIIVGYAILRLRLFDIRVVTAQGLVLLLWLFVGLRFALSLSQKEFFLNGVLFAAVLLLGVFLVRSVGKEVEGREKIERLAADLEAANKKLKELDRRKSEFLSLASHQLRAPLTAIKGYASMLLEGSFGEIGETLKKPLDTIFTSSDRLVAIIEDFLTISRIEQNRLVYNFEVANLKELVSGIADDFKEAAREKNLAFSFSAEGEGYGARIDTGKIAQIVSNVIDNAIKYTPEGSVSVTLSKPNEHTARIVVKDTGVGMDAAAKKKIFQKFSRADGANKVSTSGTGLGLYVAKMLIAAHKGRIWAESAGVGKGATFYVELPLSQ